MALSSNAYNVGSKEILNELKKGEMHLMSVKMTWNSMNSMNNIVIVVN